MLQSGYKDDKRSQGFVYALKPARPLYSLMNWCQYVIHVYTYVLQYVRLLA